MMAFCEIFITIPRSTITMMYFTGSLMLLDPLTTANSRPPISSLRTATGNKQAQGIFCELFLKWANPSLFYFLFSVFSSKYQYNFYNKYVIKCPSSIRYQDLNPQPLEHESPPKTTRPGLPVKYFIRTFLHSN